MQTQLTGSQQSLKSEKQLKVKDMEDTAIDFGVFYDVIYKNSLSATREDQEKVLYGGPLNVDLSKVVGSLGELLLNGLRQHEPGKTAFVSCLSFLRPSVPQSLIQISCRSMHPQAFLFRTVI